MLMLERRDGQKIVINDNIILTVKIVSGGRVKLGFEAPENIRIDREEIHERRKLDAKRGI